MALRRGGLGERPGDPVALQRVAADLAQRGELLVGLDALRDDRHAEVVARLGDQPHERAVAALGQLLQPVLRWLMPVRAARHP